MENCKKEKIGCSDFEVITTGQSIMDFAAQREATKVENPVILPPNAEISKETELILYITE